jgi:FixJ family two-component response regulator
LEDMSHLDREQAQRLKRLNRDAKELLAESDESLAQLEELVLEAKALRATARQTVQPATIHVVDDDDQFQTAIIRLLRAAGYEARGYKNAGEFLLATLAPGSGCILMDIRMPGPSGLDLQQALALRADPLPVIFISGHGDIATSVRAMKAGASDFLTKPIQRDTLLAAIKNALDRYDQERLLRNELTKWRGCYKSLTGRELEVFQRVVAGKMNKEIASELGASERTIKAHRAQVMEKMRATSIAELVHIANHLQSSQRSPGSSPPAG